MLKLYIKDNTNGHIHEYGTNRHDALILQEDGSLHYENLQCGVGTMFPEEGFSFCNEDGSIPVWNEDVPYIDIGGEYYMKPKTNADRIRAMSDEELAKWINDGGTVCATCAYNENCNEPFDREKCLNGILKRLQQPAEEVQ